VTVFGKDDNREHIEYNDDDGLKNKQGTTKYPSSLLIRNMESVGPSIADDVLFVSMVTSI